MNNTTVYCPACSKIVDSSKFKKIPPSTMDSLVQFDDLKIITCPNCHFSFADQKVSDDDLEYFYSESYSGIAKKVGKNVHTIDLNDNWLNTRYLSQIELVRKYCELTPQTRVLEIGSGIGDLFRTLKYLGIHTNNYVIEPGIDAHPSLEKLAVKIFKKTLNYKSLAELPKNSYDLVIMSHSLEHFNAVDIYDILRGINNSLSEGGYFLCEVPNANLIEYPDANDLVNPHLTFFTFKSIKQLLIKANFNIVFLNACGDKQLSKKPLSNEYLNRLKNKKYFDYKISVDGRVKINIGYHNWLSQKTRKNKLRVFVQNMVKKILSIAKLLSIVRKLRMQRVYDILQDSNFIYSEDREFIRVIAKKQECINKD